MKENRTRNLELDTIKFLAIFLIYTTHFIATFNRDIASLWAIYPTKIFLAGLSGKLGVAFFGILLGYFAYISGKKKSLIECSLKRYGYFVFVGLFINIIYSIWNDLPFSNVLPVSLSIGDDIFSTFWCMRAFLFASIIAYYLGESKWKFNDKIILILLLFIVGQLWLAICMLGTIISDLVENAFFKNKYLNLFWFIVLFIAIKREESDLTYILDSLFALITICVIENSNVVKKVLSNKITASLGRRTMAIFVIHPITYSLVGQWLFNNYFNNSGVGFVLVWLICFLVICILSYPVTYIFNLYNRIFETVVTFCERKIYATID